MNNSGLRVDCIVFRSKPVKSRFPSARVVLPHDGKLDYQRHFSKTPFRGNVVLTPAERAERRAYLRGIFEILLWVFAAVLLVVSLRR